MKRRATILCILGLLLTGAACTQLGGADKSSTVHATLSLVKEGIPMQVECETRRAWPDWKSKLIPAPGFVGMDIREHSLSGTTTLPCHEDETFHLFLHERYLPVELTVTYQGTLGERKSHITLTGKEPRGAYDPEPVEGCCVYAISSYQSCSTHNRQPQVHRQWRISAQDVAQSARMQPAEPPPATP